MLMAALAIVAVVRDCCMTLCVGGLWNGSGFIHLVGVKEWIRSNNLLTV